MKLQRYRPGDAADMSLIEFVGRCVPVPWAGRRAAAFPESSGCGTGRSGSDIFDISPPTEKKHDPFYPLHRQGELRPARQASQGLKNTARLQTPPQNKGAAAAEGGSA